MSDTPSATPSAPVPGVPNWLRGPSPDVRPPDWVPRPSGAEALARLDALREAVAAMDTADIRTFAALKAAFIDLIDILAGREEHQT